MLLYREDLAYVHDIGFGHLATEAARLLLVGLRIADLTTGTIVDLGCGSGITARLLCDAGYSVIGFDVSEAQLEIARRRVPEAIFKAGSFVGAPLPPCVAVTAIGEAINYAFEDRHESEARMTVFADVIEALVPGGFFMLDVAGPDRSPDVPTRTFVEHPDWAVLVEASGDRERLTRQITTFRRRGEVYRREHEEHRLHLIAPEVVERDLRRSGFQTCRVYRYGTSEFPQGLYGFVARKPRRGDK